MSRSWCTTLEESIVAEYLDGILNKKPRPPKSPYEVSARPPSAQRPPSVQRPASSQRPRSAVKLKGLARPSSAPRPGNAARPTTTCNVKKSGSSKRLLI